MPLGELQRLTTEALYLTVWISLPALSVSLLVGLAVGLLQAATQIQEQTLSFVPKLLAVTLTLAFAGAFMGAELTRFTELLFTSIPHLFR